MSDNANNHGKDAHGGGDHGGGHGHKKKHHHHAHGDHGEHEEGWIVSFADNVLLMMGFFVILLAMNMGPKGDPNATAAGSQASDRMLDLAIAVRAGFNHPLDMGSTNPDDQPLIRRMKERMNKGESREPGPDGDNHNVQAPRVSDFVNIAGMVAFHDQQSDVPDEGVNTLKDVAAKVRGNTFMIEVRGHVSALESRQDKPAAMELAYKRALSTAKLLQQNGVRWEQMRVVACADNERATPRAQNAAGHRNNQRAEVVVTQERMPPDPLATVPIGP